LQREKGEKICSREGIKKPINLGASKGKTGVNVQSGDPGYVNGSGKKHKSSAGGRQRSLKGKEKGRKSFPEERRSFAWGAQNSRNET